eukprot:TRINITY_DN5743_c0_g1_i2.p1 TRINITY_DN5743_c0_g1~~TRINITY_DN5743_c0_g1_i2.p1  ORF type:complete len:434 (+),score=97.40 TRINITY_DN5743_c0_g1_i2:80-1303(+)
MDADAWGSPGRAGGERRRYHRDSPPRRRGDGGGEHATLVALIKQGQRASPEWRDGWWAYCEKLGAAHDPSLNDTDFLRSALASLGLPQKQGRGSRGADWQRPQRGGRQRAVWIAELDALIDSRPRCGALWREYCDAYGNSDYSPQSHDEDFLETAVGWLRESTDVPWRSGGRDQRRRAQEPARQDGNDELDGLVSEVKRLQRENRETRTEWHRICDEHGDGKYDPAAHSPSFLRRALRDLRAASETRDDWSARGRPPRSPRRPGTGGKGKGGGGGKGSSGGVEELVEGVKRIQRERPQARELWRTYCDKFGDGNYDPSRHNEEFLDTALWWILDKTQKEGPRDRTADTRLWGEIQPLCDARRKAQRARAFERADELREMLSQMDVELDDRKRRWVHRPSGLSGKYND